jgi:predicted AAA+ superfamily ATPase
MQAPRRCAGASGRRASWEGLIVESLLAVVGDRAEASFYRTGGGAEVDLVLTWPDGREWAVEVKRSIARSWNEECARRWP